MNRNHLHLAILATVFAITTLPFCFHGWNWSDAATVYHFGQQFLHGRRPYMEVVYQIGPVPTWIEAAIQMSCGGGWATSVAIGVAMKAALLIMAWSWLRGMTGAIAATMLTSALSCAWLHPFHSSWMYAELATLAILLLLRSGRAFHLYLCGLVIGLLLWSRQSAGMLLGTALFFGLVLRNRTRTGLVRMVIELSWTATGIITICAYIALLLGWNDAWWPTFSGTFLTGAERKCFTGFQMMIDAVSCGTLNSDSPMAMRDYTLTALFFASMAFCLLAVHQLTRARLPHLGLAMTGFLALGLLLFPDSFILIQHLEPTWGSFTLETTRHSVGIWLGYLLPFSFCIACWICACLAPSRWETSVRIPAATVQITIPVLLAGGVMVHQVSGIQTDYLTPPTWRINPLLTIGVLWLLSGIAADRMRLALIAAAGIALPVLLNITLGIEQSSWFPDDERRTTQRYRDSGIMLHPEKTAFLETLSSMARPGDTMFICGTAPVLYDILQTINPTRLDTIYPDFATDAEVKEAARTLLRTPPRWLLVRDINPSIVPETTNPDEMESPILIRYHKRLTPLWRTIGKLKSQYRKRHTFTSSDEFLGRTYDSLSYVLYQLKTSD